MDQIVAQASAASSDAQSLREQAKSSREVVGVLQAQLADMQQEYRRVHDQTLQQHEQDGEEGDVETTEEQGCEALMAFAYCTKVSKRRGQQQQDDPHHLFTKLTFMNV